MKNVQLAFTSSRQNTSRHVRNKNKERITVTLPSGHKNQLDYEASPETGI